MVLIHAVQIVGFAKMGVLALVVAVGQGSFLGAVKIVFRVFVMLVTSHLVEIAPTLHAMLVILVITHYGAQLIVEFVDVEGILQTLQAHLVHCVQEGVLVLLVPFAQHLHVTGLAPRATFVLLGHAVLFKILVEREITAPALLQVQHPVPRGNSAQAQPPWPAFPATLEHMAMKLA